MYRSTMTISCHLTKKCSTKLHRPYVFLKIIKTKNIISVTVYADDIAVCPIFFDSVKCFSIILSLSKFHFYLSIYSKKPNKKCKQLSYGICIHSAVYIHSCLFCFTCEKKETFVHKILHSCCFVE